MPGSMKVIGSMFRGLLLPTGKQYSGDRREARFQNIPEVDQFFSRAISASLRILVVKDIPVYPAHKIGGVPKLSQP